jgi:uncharacterized protein
MDESSDDNRRQFVQMGLAAAGLGVVAASQAVAAEVPQPAGPITPAAKLPTYLVVYRPGPGWLQGKPLSAQPLKEHGQYMLDLYRRGTLRLAGGFRDGTGGAVLFEADSDASAQAIVAADPAVVSQVFIYELHPWALVAWDERARRA